MEMESAISRAQSHGLPEGNNHPPHNPDDRWPLLANWRQAIARQLPTPAPDTAAIAWKKAALASGQHEFTDTKTEMVERAIADDSAFLSSRPVRRKKGHAKAKGLRRSPRRVGRGHRQTVRCRHGAFSEIR